MHSPLRLYTSPLLYSFASPKLLHLASTPSLHLTPHFSSPLSTCSYASPPRLSVKTHFWHHEGRCGFRPGPGWTGEHTNNNTELQHKHFHLPWKLVLKCGVFSRSWWRSTQEVTSVHSSPSAVWKQVKSVVVILQTSEMVSTGSNSDYITVLFMYN